MGQYRVTKPYGPWSKGHVFTDMPGNVARMLVSRGLIEEAGSKAISAPANRAMSAPETKASRRNRQNRDFA